MEQIWNGFTNLNFDKLGLIVVRPCFLSLGDGISVQDTFRNDQAKPDDDSLVIPDSEDDEVRKTGNGIMKPNLLFSVIHNRWIVRKCSEFNHTIQPVDTNKGGVIWKTIYRPQHEILFAISNSSSIDR